MRKIKLMADYGCWPLWEASPGKCGDIDPASLPISDSLRADLLEWKRMFDAILNSEDPASSRFADEATEERFNQMRVTLAERLQQELGADYEIVLRR